MAETNSPQPQAVEERPEKPRKLSLKLKLVIYVHGEPTVSFSFSDLESYIQEENLQFALVAKFSYGRPDMIDLRKIFTRHFEIKGDCNLGLLDHRHVLVRLSNREDFVEVYSRAELFITLKEKRA
ncbi:hypothetical protein KY285_037204 [Solanum tuberosum]|nr:hypothetical protein KY285_037204 [Solanum tuberosum]